MSVSRMNPGLLPMFRPRQDNVCFSYANRVNPKACAQVYLSTRAFLTMVHGAALAARNNRQDENGFFLYGTFLREEDGSVVACIDDATDGGPCAQAGPATYCFDEKYVNHRLDFMADGSREPNRAAVGLVHIHPGSMDVFSPTDVETMVKKLLPDTRLGLLSGLINIDPALRMTMYFVRQEAEGAFACYNVPVLVSDAEIARRIDLTRPRSMGMVWHAVTGSRFPGTSVRMDDDALTKLTLGGAARPAQAPADASRAPAEPAAAAEPAASAAPAASAEPAAPATSAASAAPAAAAAPATPGPVRVRVAAPVAYCRYTYRRGRHRRAVVIAQRRYADRVMVTTIKKEE